MIKHVKYSNLINKHDMPTKYYQMYTYIICIYTFVLNDIKNDQCYELFGEEILKRQSLNQENQIKSLCNIT